KQVRKAGRVHPRTAEAGKYRIRKSRPQGRNQMSGVLIAAGFANGNEEVHPCRRFAKSPASCQGSKPARGESPSPSREGIPGESLSGQQQLRFSRYFRTCCYHRPPPQTIEGADDCEGTRSLQGCAVCPADAGLGGTSGEARMKSI